MPSSDSIEEEPYLKGKPPAAVTPKMLIKALRRLRMHSFKGLFFTPREVACEILKFHPEVEQDCQALLLEVSDKLSCAAAAGLIGSRQDLRQDSRYYAYQMNQREGDSRSELMFWIFYKRVLRKRSEERKVMKKEGVQYFHTTGSKKREKKIFRFMSFAGHSLHVIPLIHYRHLNGQSS